ncbi:MAG TPA: peptidoglycan bridge formation glycyltransferase FemA/FemB family protein [Clostridiales bacterium]|jgi:peptidoglycan pentaglycine glycine transferase (the first glycine)|nr:peptidoglycan bridge formation glycyltransferase FemA/FemB family protein [Clostridiales bacterium]
MIAYVTPEVYSEYDRFVEEHAQSHFMQTRMWGRLKTHWEWDAVLVRDDITGAIKGSLALLTRKVPGLPFSIMYGCRGPVCDRSDVKVVSALIEGAKRLAKEKKAYLLKLDPDVLASDKKFIDTLVSLGFSAPSTNRNFEGIQPRFVFRLNVAGRTEENLLNAFESKTRYNIRLARRKGVEVKICGKEAVSEFSKIMEETGARDRFVVRPASYFERLLDSLGDHARLYMAYYNDHPVAGSIAVWYGRRVWYLYGASSNSSRNVMPNYLLQWEMIRWAIENGCDEYDFRGVSGDLSPENPLYGLYRFKKGFAGDFTEFAGEFDMVLKPAVATAIRVGEKTVRFGRRQIRNVRKLISKGGSGSEKKDVKTSEE